MGFSVWTTTDMHLPEVGEGLAAAFPLREFMYHHHAGWEIGTAALPRTDLSVQIARRISRKHERFRPQRDSELVIFVVRDGFPVDAPQGLLERLGQALARVTSEEVKYGKLSYGKKLEVILEPQKSIPPR